MLHYLAGNHNHISNAMSCEDSIHKNPFTVFTPMTESLPCAQLAPGPLTTHTSWRAYSSPPLGQGCSPARQWGAPWWPAHPHLEAERRWENQVWRQRKTHSAAQQGRFNNKMTYTGGPALTVSHDTKHIKVCWRAFYEPSKKKDCAIVSVNNVVFLSLFYSLLLLPEWWSYTGMWVSGVMCNKTPYCSRK